MTWNRTALRLAQSRDPAAARATVLFFSAARNTMPAGVIGNQCGIVYRIVPFRPPDGNEPAAMNEHH